jgi:hypothetical protein
MKNLLYTIKTNFWTILGIVAFSSIVWGIVRALIGSEGFAYNALG